MTKRTFLRAAAGLLALAAAAGGLFHFARSRSVQAFGRLVARVETGARVVALTFDDGPTIAPMDEILGVLESRQVRATFFVNGIDLAQAPDLGRRLVAAGHEIGNHTYSHDRMVLRSQEFIRLEVERTDELIRGAGQAGDICFRPPFCWKLLGLPWYLARTGRTTVTWDVDADRPPFGRDPSLIVSECVRAVRPGSIILLHVWYPGREPSRVALPTIVDRIQAEGYRFVTVRDLLKAMEVWVTTPKQEIKPPAVPLSTPGPGPSTTEGVGETAWNGVSWASPCPRVWGVAGTGAGRWLAPTG